ncbi:carbohydrate ABC transporter permease [Humibacillus xanthopallidus]|nr:carbohydrate ABC transporter permease [Humibacillus xanthopallidus]
MALGAVAMVAPFVWMLLTSLKSPSELTEFSWLPDQLRFQNYTEALTAAPFARYFLNTAVLTIGQTALTLLFATSAGYALACTPIRGRKALNAFVVILIMVPFYAILIPEFLVVKSIPLFGGNSITGQGGIGWLNSWWGLIIPHAIAPIYIFLARQFFVSLPEELAEAARVDGLSEYGIFFRIMLPLIKPAVITVAVFQIGAAWNSFLWPLLITRDDSLRPIQVGLAIFSQDPLNVQWAYLMAGATLAVLPMIALFIAAQRYFIEGMASAGLKG